MRASVKALTLWNGAGQLIAMWSLIGASALQPDDVFVASVFVSGFFIALLWILSAPLTTLLAAVLNHRRAKLPALTLFNLGAAALWLPTAATFALALCAC